MTQRGQYQGVFSRNSFDELIVGLGVIEFEEDNTTILYAPSLELYGYGKNHDEAKDSLDVAVAEFLTYTKNKGTFEAELSRLGWIIKGRKNNRKYLSPALSQAIQKNKRVIDIFDQKERVVTGKVDVNLSAVA